MESQDVRPAWPRTLLGLALLLVGPFVAAVPGLFLAGLYGGVVAGEVVGLAGVALLPMPRYARIGLGIVYAIGMFIILYYFSILAVMSLAAPPRS